MTNIQISCQGTTVYIHKQVQKDFSNYSKLLVQINNGSKDSLDYIYLDMHGTATATPVKAHIIVYGVKDWSDSVNPEVYDNDLLDTIFEYKNKQMTMKTNIDMQIHRLINLGNAIDDLDGVTKRDLDNVYYYTNNHTYRTIFGDNFYDLKETSKFNLVKGVNGVVIHGVQPNLFLDRVRYINNFNLYYGLKLSSKTHITTNKIHDQNSSCTIFISFWHDKKHPVEISWPNTVNPQLPIKFYPRYQITADKLIIDYATGTYEKSLTSNFQNKQIFVWISRDGSNNFHRM